MPFLTAADLDPLIARAVVAGVDVVVGRSSRRRSHCARCGQPAPPAVCGRPSNGARDRSTACSTTSTSKMCGCRCRRSATSTRSTTSISSLTPWHTERSASRSWPRSATRCASSTSASPTNGPTATFRGRSPRPAGHRARPTRAFDGSPTYVICRSGGRSARACEFAAEQGLDTVNVVGGMLAWETAGFEVGHEMNDG